MCLLNVKFNRKFEVIQIGIRKHAGLLIVIKSIWENCILILKRDHYLFFEQCTIILVNMVQTFSPLKAEMTIPSTLGAHCTL